MPSGGYRDLIVWHKAMDLVETVYRSTAGFPRDETYGLRSQIRRAAISVPSNIAEGEGRGTKKEFLRFLAIARGSLKELETQVLIAQRLALMVPESASRILAQSDEISRLLAGLKRNLISREDLR